MTVEGPTYIVVDKHSLVEQAAFLVTRSLFSRPYLGHRQWRPCPGEGEKPSTVSDIPLLKNVKTPISIRWILIKSLILWLNLLGIFLLIVEGPGAKLEFF